MKNTDWRESSQYMQAVARENATMNECVERSAEPKSLRDMTEEDFQQAHGEQPATPVAWMNDDDGDIVPNMDGNIDMSRYGWIPLYARPDPRIAELERELAAAQAERDDFKAAYLSVIGERKKAEADAAALRAAYDHICMHIKFDDGLAYMPENEFPRLFTKLDAAIDQARKESGNES